MVKEIQLIALDMDGTLLGNNENVSKGNRKAIYKARQKGIEVIISTGRHYQTSYDVAKALDIHYLITMNGAEIWTQTGDLIARQTMDPAIIEQLMALKEKYQPWTWLSSTDRLWQNETPEELTAHQWLKVGFDTDDPKVKDEIITTIEKWEEIEWSNSSPTNIEINAVGVHKAAAIDVVRERLGIEMSQVMAMGDSLNDIKMIEKAGLGIAMGNAQEEVKKAADWITTTNVNDGVARAIEKWVL